MTSEKQQIILLVDDEELNLKVIAGYLSGLGARLIGALNGMDAIEKASGIPPDLILLDVVMPELDGFETCRRIKQSEGLKDIPVIFLSTLDDVKSKVKGFELGGDDFISKPITKEELVARVRHHLNLRRMRNRVEEQNRRLKAEAYRLSKAENALKESDRRFKLLFGNIKIVIGMLDPEGRYIQLNDFCEEMFGYTRQEMKGRSCLDVQHPDERQRSVEAMERMRGGEESYVETEKRMLRKDGGVFWGNHTLSVIRDASGRCRGFVCFVTDITERKASEELLRKLSRAVEQSQNTVMITDPEGVVEFVNPAFTTSSGYSSEEVLGSRARFLGTSNQDSKLYKEMWGVISQGGVWRGEFANRRRDGSLYWEMATISPVKSEDGKITNFVVVKEDITSRKRAEEALKMAKQTAEHAKRMAEGASKAKSDFLATMSHEIRTPMGGVLGMADLLLDSELTEKQRQQVETIRRSGRTLIRVINDILDFSKIQAGKMALQSRSFNLGEVIDNMADLFREKFEAKGIRFHVANPPDKVPQLLQGDPERLSQILYNIVGNAEKFTDKGSVFVEVSVAEDREDDIKLRFDITDTGIGISDAYREQIFEAFSQEDASVNRKYGGTGLGLVISRKLVSLMGGELNFSSVEGKGSNFWFTGNYGKQEFSAENEYEAERRQKRESEKITFDAHILVAEDNLVNQQVAKDTLELMGCEVEIAEDGERALEMLSNRHPDFDLVLMDCEMPGIDGYQATAQWREIEEERKIPRIPVVALTAHVLDTFRDKAINSGMDDFISKPFSRVRLQDVLIKWLRDGGVESGATAQRRKLKARSKEINVSDASLDMEVIEQLKDMDIVTLVQLYLKQSPEILQKIYKAVEEGDHDRVRKAAHTLKSSSATIGAMRLSQMCKRLEDANRERFSMADLSLEELQTEFLTACHSLLEVIENDDE